MPNQINASSSLWKQNQNDIFSDGKNDQSSANAGAIITASAAEGQAQTTAAIDGNLSDIDTGAKALVLDPAENTGGNAVQAHSSTFLLRWAIKLLQGISGKLPTLVGGKIPVDAGGATAGDIGTAVNSALKATPQSISVASLPLPAGAATESTLATVRDRLRVSDYSVGSTTTSATGTQYVALESGASTAITIRNRGGTTIEVRRVGGTNTLRVEDREDLPLPVLANSNEWEIRRSDTSNTQVSIRFLRYTA